MNITEIRTRPGRKPKRINRMVRNSWIMVGYQAFFTAALLAATAYHLGWNDWSDVTRDLRQLKAEWIGD